MRVARLVVVVVAIFGGVFALLGYASVVKDEGSSDAAYAWLALTGILLLIGGVLAANSRPRDQSWRQKTCPNCARPAQEDWSFCPRCGALLSFSERSPEGVLPGPNRGEWLEEVPLDEEYEADGGLAGRALVWLGIIVLDVLFVLVVLWLFRPSLALSQHLFQNGWAPPGIVILDVGLASALLGYSVAPSWAFRL